MKASVQIMNDLRGDNQQFTNLLQETLNGIEYQQSGFSAYNNTNLMRYQLKLMLSRLELLQDTLSNESIKPE